MKVSINSKTVCCFPTSLVINRLFAWIIRRKLKKRGINLSQKGIALFIKELKKYEKSNPDWNIVEVTNNRRGIIKITI
jgi:hypothetical protein